MKSEKVISLQSLSRKQASVNCTSQWNLLKCYFELFFVDEKETNNSSHTNDMFSKCLYDKLYKFLSSTKTEHQNLQTFTL